MHFSIRLINDNNNTNNNNNNWDGKCTELYFYCDKIIKCFRYILFDVCSKQFLITFLSGLFYVIITQ